MSQKKAYAIKNKTLRFLVEIQFVERGLVERGLVESGHNEHWWKVDIGGKIKLVEKQGRWNNRICVNPYIPHLSPRSFFLLGGSAP